MNHINFQSVFDKLQEVLPPSWEEVVFYASYTSGSYSMKYYVKNGTETVDCFNQPGVNKMQLVKIFMDIDKELAAVRKNLAPTELWSVMTMIIDGDGNMKTHFDYADISEDVIEHTRSWEQKYL